MKNLLNLSLLSTATFMLGWSVSSITNDVRPVIVQVMPKPEIVKPGMKQSETDSDFYKPPTVVRRAKRVHHIKAIAKPRQVEVPLISKDWATQINADVTPFTVDSTVIVLYRSEDTIRIYTGDIPYSTI